MSENARKRTTPLFKGQKTHAISLEEWQLLEKKIKIMGDLVTHEKVMAALREMAQCPTGRRQIREIIASDQVFPVECSKERDAELSQMGVAGYNQKKVLMHYPSKVRTYTGKTCVHSKYIDDPKQFGAILLHEMLHQRQSLDLPESSVIADMETQALSAQLGIELGNDKDNCVSYRQSYAQNLRKWRAIMRGELPRPDWAPPFEVIEQGNMSDDEYAKLKKVAENEYIKQMAADELQAQFMADFTMSRTAMNNGDFSMGVPSYDGIRTHLFYDSYGVKKDLRDMTLSPELKSYLKERYPALDIAKVEKHTQELHAEYFELDSVLTQLSGKLEKSLSPQMNLKERVIAVKQCIRELACSKEAKKILAEETMDLFTNNRSLSDPKEIIGLLRQNLNTTYSHADARAEIQAKGVDEIVRNMLQQTSYLEIVKYVAKRSDLSTSAKLYQFAEIVRWHKEQYPETDKVTAKERREMLAVIRKTTGLDGLPLVQNGDSLQDSLRSSSGGAVQETKEEDVLAVASMNRNFNNRLA